MSIEAKKEAKLLDHPEIMELCEHLITTRNSKKSFADLEEAARQKIKNLMTEFEPEAGDRFLTETAIIDWNKGRESMNQAEFRTYLISHGVSFSLIEEADKAAKTTGAPVMVISPRDGSVT